MESPDYNGLTELEWLEREQEKEMIQLAMERSLSDFQHQSQPVSMPRGSLLNNNSSGNNLLPPHLGQPRRQVNHNFPFNSDSSSIQRQRQPQQAMHNSMPVLYHDLRISDDEDSEEDDEEYTYNPYPRDDLYEHRRGGGPPAVRRAADTGHRSPYPHHSQQQRPGNHNSRLHSHHHHHHHHQNRSREQAMDRSYQMDRSYSPVRPPDGSSRQFRRESYQNYSDDDGAVMSDYDYSRSNRGLEARGLEVPIGGSGTSTAARRRRESMPAIRPNQPIHLQQQQPRDLPHRRASFRQVEEITERVIESPHHTVGAVGRRPSFSTPASTPPDNRSVLLQQQYHSSYDYRTSPQGYPSQGSSPNISRTNSPSPHRFDDSSRTRQSSRSRSPIPPITSTPTSRDPSIRNLRHHRPPRSQAREAVLQTARQHLSEEEALLVEQALNLAMRGGRSMTPPNNSQHSSGVRSDTTLSVGSASFDEMTAEEQRQLEEALNASILDTTAMSASLEDDEEEKAEVEDSTKIPQPPTLSASDTMELFSRARAADHLSQEELEDIEQALLDSGSYHSGRSRNRDKSSRRRLVHRPSDKKTARDAEGMIATKRPAVVHRSSDKKTVRDAAGMVASKRPAVVQRPSDKKTVRDAAGMVASKRPAVVHRPSDKKSARDSTGLAASKRPAVDRGVLSMMQDSVTEDDRKAAATNPRLEVAPPSDHLQRDISQDISVDSMAVARDEIERAMAENRLSQEEYNQLMGALEKNNKSASVVDHNNHAGDTQRDVAGNKSDTATFPEGSNETPELKKEVIDPIREAREISDAQGAQKPLQADLAPVDVTGILGDMAGFGECIIAEESEMPQELSTSPSEAMVQARDIGTGDNIQNNNGHGETEKYSKQVVLSMPTGDNNKETYKETITQGYAVRQSVGKDNEQVQDEEAATANSAELRAISLVTDDQRRPDGKSDDINLPPMVRQKNPPQLSMALAALPYAKGRSELKAAPGSVSLDMEYSASEVDDSIAYSADSLLGEMHSSESGSIASLLPGKPSSRSNSKGGGKELLPPSLGELAGDDEADDVEAAFGDIVSPGRSHLSEDAEAQPCSIMETADELTSRHSELSGAVHPSKVARALRDVAVDQDSLSETARSLESTSDHEEAPFSKRSRADLALPDHDEVEQRPTPRSASPDVSDDYAPGEVDDSSLQDEESEGENYQQRMLDRKLLEARGIDRGPPKPFEMQKYLKNQLWQNESPGHNQQPTNKAGQRFDGAISQPREEHIREWSGRPEHPPLRNRVDEYSRRTPNMNDPYLRGDPEQEFREELRKRQQTLRMHEYDATNRQGQPREQLGRDDRSSQSKRLPRRWLSGPDRPRDLQLKRWRPREEMTRSNSVSSLGESTQYSLASGHLPLSREESFRDNGYERAFHEHNNWRQSNPTPLPDSLREATGNRESNSRHTGSSPSVGRTEERDRFEEDLKLALQESIRMQYPSLSRDDEFDHDIPPAGDAGQPRLAQEQIDHINRALASGDDNAGNGLAPSSRPNTSLAFGASRPEAPGASLAAAGLHSHVIPSTSDDALDRALQEAKDEDERQSLLLARQLQEEEELRVARASQSTPIIPPERQSPAEGAVGEMHNSRQVTPVAQQQRRSFRVGAIRSTSPGRVRHPLEDSFSSLPVPRPRRATHVGAIRSSSPARVRHPTDGSFSSLSGGRPSHVDAVGSLSPERRPIENVSERLQQAFDESQGSDPDMQESQNELQSERLQEESHPAHVSHDYSPQQTSTSPHATSPRAELERSRPSQRFAGLLRRESVRGSKSPAPPGEKKVSRRDSKMLAVARLGRKSVSSLMQTVKRGASVRTFASASSPAPSESLDRSRSEEIHTASPPEELDEDVILEIDQAIDRGVISQLNEVVKVGNESTIYHADGGIGNGAFDVAVKIYKRAGRDDSTKAELELWTTKEFRNLTKAKKGGVSAPIPLFSKENILFMQFMGRDGRPAPQLGELDLRRSHKRWKTLYKQIVEALRRLYTAALLVHGNLNEKNILVVSGENSDQAVLIDFGHSVDSKHPDATELLRNDLQRLRYFFVKQGTRTPTVDDTMKFVTNSNVPSSFKFKVRTESK